MHPEHSFIVVGYKHSMVERGGIGSLLLAARKGDDWVYVGSVGTDFNERSAECLRKTLDKIKRKTPPVKYEGRGKNLVWVQLTLIAEIAYRAWTHDGKLRHASYKGRAKNRIMRQCMNCAQTSNAPRSLPAL